MEFIDIGINLTHESFTEDREPLIRAARDAGVSQLIVTGATLAHSAEALALAQAHPRRLFATAGVHPHHASELTADSLQSLAQLLAKPEVVASGECGLDYFRNFSPQPAQRDGFARQLELAIDAGKPLFLHQRDAHADFMAVLRAHPAALAHGGVAHCFTGDARELEDYLALGLHIGITGWICDERRGAHLKALVTRIPPDRLLLETDAPYLLPRDLSPKPRSRRNEPRFLPHIAAFVAACRAQPLSDLAAQCVENTRRLFALPAL